MKLFTPGPIAMDSQTLEIGGIQSQYCRTPDFSQKMQECAALLEKIIDAPSESRMIFLTASGTAAMEATVMNLFTSKDTVLIITGGTFGNRFKRICDIHQIPVKIIEVAHDTAFNLQSLEQYEQAEITGMLVNVCETSTGQLLPMPEIAEFCKRNNIILVADAISSFLSDPFSMQDWGISATIISSQKGLALHPGMSFIAISKDTFEKRCKKIDPQSLYFDFKNYYPEILRGQTDYTPAISIINQLHEKLIRINKETVENYINHAYSLAIYFRKKISTTNNFSCPKYPLSNCITPVYCKNKNAKKITEILRDEYDIFVAPTAGNLTNIQFRVAHMSKELTKQDFDDLVATLIKIENIEDNK